MRALGLLLLLFGMVVLALHFFEVRPEWLGWMHQWGNEGVLGIGVGAIVLGFVLTIIGRKKNPQAR